MLTTLDEIADGIYRISTFVPEIGPDGFTFNQFLLDAEEPLLYHTGMKALFPLVSLEVARVRPLEQLQWIAFAHVEADECGAIEQFLAAAPNAQVAHGVTGCMVSLNDMLSRPPRPLADGETVDRRNRRDAPGGGAVDGEYVSDRRADPGARVGRPDGGPRGRVPGRA